MADIQTIVNEAESLANTASTVEADVKSVQAEVATAESFLQKVEDEFHKLASLPAEIKDKVISLFHKKVVSANTAA